ncbi:MAG: UDP-3-O-[3-hydroxymyristoyl] N-acetylglucosamine deacetylase [Gemmatimonadales bacterium]|nr:UDP-3-O-[3-hydroxymyristoyl] N-acetylglucosamine deacetylase [Gemmatimonadales bacterium]
MSQARRTVARPATVNGTGLHSGDATTATLKPAQAGSGVVFRRSDLSSVSEIPARLEAVRSAERRTCLGDDEAQVHTVEHLLAALAAHGIDDLVIELDGPEPPIGDGSAAMYFNALAEAGVTDVGGIPTRHTVSRPMVVREGDAVYTISPNDSLRLTVTIEWDHPIIGRQSGCYDITPDVFASDLAEARTFGFQRDAEALREKGLAQGASTANTIVLSDSEVVGTELRWPDEFVRHKAVDLLGDLALLGGRLQADVVAFRPSHQGNIALGRAILRTAPASTPPITGIQEILGALPHRYPMLLVDRIVELEPGERIVGIKNVTANEPFFQGHFPGHPVMPGVLIVEAMAQTGGMMLMGQVDDPESKVVYFMAIDNVKFRRPVIPGDQLRLELEMIKFRGKTCRMRGVGYVDGSPVAEAEMMAAVVDR